MDDLAKARRSGSPADASHPSVGVDHGDVTGVDRFLQSRAKDAHEGGGHDRRSVSRPVPPVTTW